MEKNRKKTRKGKEKEKKRKRKGKEKEKKRREKEKVRVRVANDGARGQIRGCQKDREECGPASMQKKKTGKWKIKGKGVGQG